MNASVISTFRCNAKCHMCNIWQFPSSKNQEITPDIVSKLPDGLGRINLSGGEPMLREDIEDLVGILYKKCRKVEISTNGFYTDKIVKIANEYPGIMIRISLEGLPALNDSLRGTKNGFDHALRTMLELKKTKIRDIGFSVVICDRNAADLVHLYDLAVSLGVEFAQSTMHNSWYFHKSDNRIVEQNVVTNEMKRFIKSLLSSRRQSLKLRLKDWLRAFFNLRIYHHASYGYSYQNSCTAGSDLFFLDPFGNISPCNGSDEQGIMGNLKYQSFDEIWNSEEAIQIRRNVKNCRKDCAFIGTARFDMLRNPLRTINWIAKNKIRIMRGRDICLDPVGGKFIVNGLDDHPVVERSENKKLVMK
ncbi:MAG: radical SAM protein [candidate division Zixibacteria bacterium]|nr:radical SAM protein [candidate division Zixibacteria bacterium]